MTIAALTMASDVFIRLALNLPEPLLAINPFVAFDARVRSERAGDPPFSLSRARALAHATRIRFIVPLTRAGMHARPAGEARG